MKGEVVESQADGIVVSLVNREGARLTVPLRGEVPAKGAAVTIGVRPEHFGAAGAGDVDIAVNVDVVEQLGATSYAYAGVSGEELVIERDPKLAAGRGGALTVSIAVATCYAFDSGGRRLR